MLTYNDFTCNFMFLILQHVHRRFNSGRIDERPSRQKKKIPRSCYCHCESAGEQPSDNNCINAPMNHILCKTQSFDSIQDLHSLLVAVNPIDTEYQSIDR